MSTAPTNPVSPQVSISTAVAAPASPRTNRKPALPTLAVLSLGVAAAPIAAGAAALAWMYRAQRNLDLSARRQLVDQSATAVARTAESLLKARDADALRVALKTQLDGLPIESCAVTLADGAIVAHSDPTRVNARSLPEKWPKPALVSPSPGVESFEDVEARRTIDLGEGNIAAVAIRAPLPPPPAILSAFVAPLAGIGLTSLALGAFLYRRASAALRPLQAIHGSMRALAAGETAIEALTIAPRFGPEAAAWNAFLAARRSQADQELDRQLAGATGAGRSGDGLLERACDALAQGVILFDSGGRVRYANGAAAALLCKDRKDLSGRQIAAISDDQRLIATVRAVAEQGVRRRGAVELSRGEGDETSVLRFTCCRAAGSAAPASGQSVAESGAAGPSILFIEDLTQQRIADRSRDAFVANATHELRTPLTNMRLYLETLLEGGDKDPKTRGDCINVINQEARRLERMVGDMLSVSEIEAGSLKLHTDDVRLDQLLKELEADYQAQASGKNITLVFDLPPKIPVLKGDRDKITMSLHNLIGNALKYTPDGGTVTVTLEDTATSIAVRVRDTGIGISPEEAERIFEKFYRSKDRRIAKITGTGLGLAIAREVVRLHGGDITVNSQIDQGSTFTLTLPHLAQAA